MNGSFFSGSLYGEKIRPGTITSTGSTSWRISICDLYLALKQRLLSACFDDGVVKGFRKAF